MNDEHPEELTQNAREAISRIANREAIQIPDEIDRAILTAAADRSALIRRGRRPITLRPIRWAAAAALLLAIGIWGFNRSNDEPRRDATATLVGDIDHDGHIDIVDAYLLDRELVGASRPEWDFDGNGRVDASDVRHLAARAVALDGGNG